MLNLDLTCRKKESIKHNLFNKLFTNEGSEGANYFKNLSLHSILDIGPAIKKNKQTNKQKKTKKNKAK